MMKIDLDGVDTYISEASNAIIYLIEAKNKLATAASNMESIGIGSDELSLYNPAYTDSAMEAKRQAIVSDINAKKDEITNLLSSLNAIESTCNIFIEEVEEDDNTISTILGDYASEDYGQIEVTDYSETKDILTFDFLNCDYYVNGDTKLYFQIPEDKSEEEKYKILDIGEDSYVKVLYYCDDGSESSVVGDYAVVLCKNTDNRIRIGYINENYLSPITSDEDGNTTSKSNLEDGFAQASGYGIIVNNKGNDLTIKPFPSSEQGEYTDSLYRSGRESYTTELPEGTCVKIVGKWVTDEDDNRSSYLVAFSNKGGNFMGFVDGKNLQTSGGAGDFDTVDDVLPIKVTADNAEIICSDGVTRTAPKGTVFTNAGGYHDDYYNTVSIEGSEIAGLIKKEDSEQIMTSSLSKLEK